MGNVFTNFFWMLRGGPDGDEDDDELSNGDEMVYGTNPVVADTDGDGWVDGIEVAERSDPLDPQSYPRTFYTAPPPISFHVPDINESGGPLQGLTLGRPPITIKLPKP
jgi:hypothetical protein